MIDDIFIYPTDTVWGIGGSIYDREGFKKINGYKKIKKVRPFTLLFHSREILRHYLKPLPSFYEKNLFAVLRLEVTLILPSHFFNYSIPSFVTAGSRDIAFRYIEVMDYSQITERISDPITSTSLNITGDDPITEERDALDFFNQICPDAIFIKDKQLKFSKSSSTIVSISEVGRWSIKREGAQVEKIKNLLKLSGYG